MSGGGREKERDKGVRELERREEERVRGGWRAREVGHCVHMGMVNELLSVTKENLDGPVIIQQNRPPHITILLYTIQYRCTCMRTLSLQVHKDHEIRTPLNREHFPR